MENNWTIIVDDFSPFKFLNIHMMAESKNYNITSWAFHHI